MKLSFSKLVTYVVDNEALLNECHCLLCAAGRFCVARMVTLVQASPLGFSFFSTL